MKLRFVPAKSTNPLSPEVPSPQQLFDIAAADEDYSKKACLRSLAVRTVMLTNDMSEHDQDPASQAPEAAPGMEGSTPPPGILTRLAVPLKRLLRIRSAHKNPSTPQPGERGTSSFAVASIVHAEPGLWQGQKAHFIRLHVEYHPDATHHLERVDVTVRVWKAGDALESLAPLSHLHLLSVEPPDAPEFGDDAPPIVLYTPRAVVGREAGSKAEPYWDGHFRTGDHFLYFAQATPPRDFESDGPQDSTQPRSLLEIAALGDPEEMRVAPSFDVAMVVLSEGKPFDMTVYSTSVHWGVRGVERYLFDPYKPAKFGPSTRLIPKGERPIASDFAGAGMKEKLIKRVNWCKSYDTVSVTVLDTRYRLNARYGSAEWTDARRCHP